MWMHVPVGILNGVWLVFLPVLGIGLLCGFLVYEIEQCRYISDGAFHDILGHVVGLVIGGLIATVAVVLLVLYILEGIL